MLHARLRAAAGNRLWTPANISTALWLDAADSDTLTLDGSGNLSGWADKSGNGNAGTAPSPGASPALISNGLNSNPIIRFDGTDDVIQGASSASLDEYIFIVYKWAYTARFKRVYAMRDITTDATSYSIYDFDATWLARTDLTNGRGNTYFVTSGVWQIFSGNHPNNGAGSEEFYIDSETPSIDTNSQATSGTIPASSYSIGARWDDSFSEIDVAEVVVSGSPGERERIEGYLAHKWGLTANLPTGHPYKSEAP